MLAEIILPLAHYNIWANEQICHSLETLTEEQFHADIPSSFPSIVKTIAHIHGAEDVWRQRLQKVHPTLFYKLSDETIGSVELNKWIESSRLLMELILSYDDMHLSETVNYFTLKGETCGLLRWQMIQHCVNHSSYHRGQLITMMRQIGVASIPNTDMIAFYRKTNELIK